jgi:hypothetical protein
MNSGHDQATWNHGRRGPLWSVGLVVAMVAFGAALVITRRPDAITNPQFWAEDGKYWFADAYTHGAQALLQSNEGYLQTLPWLVAAPVAGLSLGHAALVFNLAGIALQVAPVAFFLSRRFEHVAPRAWVRALVGVGYLLIPSFELNVTGLPVSPSAPRRATACRSAPRRRSRCR